MTRRFSALVVLAAGVSLLPCLPASAQIEDALRGTATTEVVRKTTNSVDFSLFAKACSPYISDSFQSDSELNFQMQGASPEQSATFGAKVSVVSGSGGKYRSDISFTKPDGSAGPRYRLVNDGENVTISDLGAKQYSIMKSAAFQASSDAFMATGFFGSLMRGEFRLLAKLFDDPAIQDADPKEIEEGIKKGLKEKGGDITQETATVGGKVMTVFILTMENGTFRFIVDPVTKTMSRVEMKTTSAEGVSVTITEKLAIKSPASDSGEAFRFVAPSGSKKVASVSISPLGE